MVMSIVVGSGGNRTCSTIQILVGKELTPPSHPGLMRARRHLCSASERTYLDDADLRRNQAGLTRKAPRRRAPEALMRG